MKIAIGLDWSDQAFSAVQQALMLYRADEVTFAHGVDLGIFEYPMVAGAAALQGYEEFRDAMLKAGHQLMDRAVTLLPADAPSVRRVCVVGSPARVVLDAADNAGADLVVVGARNRGHVAEVVLGSVSHRILMHGSRTTLIVKGAPRNVRRVLVAVEGMDDAGTIRDWLRAHPFRHPVELTLLTAVPSLRLADPYNAVGFETWSNAAHARAQDLLKSVASSFADLSKTISTQVVTGEPADEVARKAADMDLVMVGSHGRKGFDRFLLGSVSHAMSHRVPASILVVRTAPAAAS